MGYHGRVDGRLVAVLRDMDIGGAVIDAKRFGPSNDRLGVRMRTF